MLQQKISRISFFIAFSVLGLMWLVYFLDVSFHLELYRHGIYPLHTKGLLGVLAAPFIHSTEDIGHILNNSLPTLVLTWLLFYHYRTIATRVFIIIYLMTGFSMWLLARESYHIGMSGVIYGLTSFLVFSGFFRKNMRVAAVSLFVIFIYGSMVWGIFPVKENISWEGHALGLFSGIIVAVLYKHQGPQPQKMIYEIEEEAGIEPEEEYWKEGEIIPPHSGPPGDKPDEPGMTITYNYKPNSEEKGKM